MLNVSILPIRSKNFTIRVTKISEYPILNNSFEIWSKPADLFNLKELMFFAIQFRSNLQASKWPFRRSNFTSTILSISMCLELDFLSLCEKISEYSTNGNKLVRRCLQKACKRLATCL